MDPKGAARGEPSFAIPGSVLVREVGGEMVLLNLDSETYFGLNRSGAEIVARLTSLPLDVALASLAADFDVDEEVLRRDIQDLVRTLVDAGLVDQSNDGH